MEHFNCVKQFHALATRNSNLSFAPIRDNLSVVVFQQALSGNVKSHASFSYNPTRAAAVADVYISGEP